MAAAIEHAIEQGVDVVLAMREQLVFRGRVHPRVHGAGQQAQAVLREHRIDLGGGVGKAWLLALHVRHGVGGFGLNQMAGQFIHPGDRAIDMLDGLGAGGLRQ